jgi:imidazolonepropionase-like amidohydrolase
MNSNVRCRIRKTGGRRRPAGLALLPLVVGLAIVLSIVHRVEVRAEAPHAYAIIGARIVTAAGAPIETGTVLVRNGLIEAVGASVTVPPAATVIDGRGLTVYPGLIDMGNPAGLELPPAQAPQARNRMEAERWKRQQLLRPQFEAANNVRADAPELGRLAAAGITTILSAPPGDVFRGQSSLINVVAPDDPPQIGNIADERRGLYVVKTPVALHIMLSERPQGTTYPVSLLGSISFVRQAFFDAEHYQLEWARYRKSPAGVVRPVYDQALDALEPALLGREPVALHADTMLQIRRALNLAREFNLDPVIVGGLEADQVVPDLEAAKARLIYSLNYPVRSRALAPDADETLEALTDRANAPKVPAEIEKAGLLLAFTTGGLRDPADFVRNAAKAVKAGLPADAAIRALTINAATIAGAADRVGSIEKGKIANLLLVEGDLFSDTMRIRQVFVDGRPVNVDAEPAPVRGGARGRGGF